MTDKELISVPSAWRHDGEGRVDVISNEVRELWLRVSPKKIGHYTIPLFERKEPLSIEGASWLLIRTVGVSPEQDGNLLKIVRAVERAHGIV